MKRIIVSNLNKKFKVHHGGSRSVLARVRSLFFACRRIRNKKKIPVHNSIQVAKDISFEAQAGENIGIIGLNGSGKSTLLRLIAEIYRPDAGELYTNGSLVYLAGFGQGLQPLLTMRDNIYLMGAIMGLSNAEIRTRFDDMVRFAGLEDFIDTKVYRFSSGMSARLNFSVMIFCLNHRKPDILLLDETLSGAGDIDFQASAVLKMEECIKGGSTVLLVSHDLSIIEKYCDRVIWLHKGEVVKIGTAQEVIADYVKSNH